MKMTNVQSEIDRIRSCSLDATDLLRCLNSPLLLVRANAIVNVVQRDLADPRLIAKLAQISQQRDSGRLMGTMTCARLALASLYWLGTPESRHEYDEIRDTLESDELGYLEELIQEGCASPASFVRHT